MQMAKAASLDRGKASLDGGKASSYVACTHVSICI